jgi:hypothetical protein
VIRTGKDTGLGHFPSHGYGLNASWLDAAMTGCILLAWLKLLALDGDLAKAEPKTLRYRLLHAAARLVRGGRRRTLKIAAAWPWSGDIVTAWQRIHASSQDCSSSWTNSTQPLGTSRRRSKSVQCHTRLIGPRSGGQERQRPSASRWVRMR